MTLTSDVTHCKKKEIENAITGIFLFHADVLLFLAKKNLTCAKGEEENRSNEAKSILRFTGPLSKLRIQTLASIHFVHVSNTWTRRVCN